MRLHGVCVDCEYSNPIEEQQGQDGSASPAAAAATGETTMQTHNVNVRAARCIQFTRQNRC